ncbi:hypothetical protein QTJ16_001094 [Diplocarpon rosae]|uniref:Uncharacterized protein n=1 Tax=Diplocarpon rosae TaxID=946125 RepID=A0AAD9WI03_9HELO|nr:hypothetical protein QTJ16_001094 [Diplocarpon rosae]
MIFRTAELKVISLSQWSHMAQSKLYQKFALNPTMSRQPLFAKAQELDVPAFIHPLLHQRICEIITREAITMAPSSFGWGWHPEIHIHTLRLFRRQTV